MPSSWILRVSVLRPQPSRCAASIRCPPVFPVERVVPLGRVAALPCARRFAHLGRKIGDADALPRRHHGEPVADVLQLAHVAGKRERRQRLHRIVGELLRLDRELARALLQQVPREQRWRTRSSRSWWVAAITRTLDLSGAWPPTR